MSMKYLSLFFIFLIFISCDKNNSEQVISKNSPIKVQTQITQSAPMGEIDSNGNNIGEWIFYYPTGEIKKTGFYKDGEKSGKWRFFHKNEKIKYIEEYVNGAENGKWLSFDENGELVAKGFYKNGEKDGKWITDFYDNGKIHIEEFFKEGKPVGSMNVYLENGKLLETTFYSNYNYYNSFHPHAELDRMAKLAESMGIYDHNVEAYHRAIDAGDRGDVDAFVKALYDIDPTLDLDY